MNLEHFDQLLDEYLLGELSLEQSAKLQEAMESDAAARRRFVQRIFIETGLHHLARSDPAALMPAPETGPRRRIAPGRVVRLRRLAVAAVVLFSIGALAAFYFARRDSGNFARVTSGNVLVDGQSRDRITEGSTLSVTGSAPAVIQLFDGSQATLDPATQLTLRGRVDGTRQVLHLAAGGGQFEVTHGGGQFRIDTPVGSVAVLGTQFTAVLRSPRTLFVSVAAGTVRFDGDGQSVTLSAGQSRTFGPVPERPATRLGADAEIMNGWINSVDLNAGTFVLGGEKESRTTFRIGVRTGEKRGDCLLLLDGKIAKPEAAMKPGRKAFVTYVKVGDEMGASKVEIVSAPK